MTADEIHNSTKISTKIKGVFLKDFFVATLIQIHIFHIGK